MLHRKIFAISLLAAVSFTACKESRKTTENTKTSIDSASADNSWYKNANIYEVNLRQYTKEGTMKAFAKELPRLKDMGVEILWFMPITPIGIEGRKQSDKELGSYYAVRNYTAVNEEFGTMDDWKDLVKQAHEMGFKVITDWVANHSAPDNHWIKERPQFYEKDSAGNFTWTADWTDTRLLDYSNKELRDSMTAAMKFWLTETGIDGFRCDVAAEVPADFWKDCIASLRALRPSLFMLAEGDQAFLIKAGFDATYAWPAAANLQKLYAGKMTLASFDSSINAGIDTFPPHAAKMFFTTNHDENSWNGTEFEKYGNAYKTFAVFTQTIANSIPLIYSGQEMPNKKRLKFFVHDPIEWTGTYAMAPFYKTLLTMRKSNPALSTDASYRRLPSTDQASVFAYVREKDGRKAVVVLNMSARAKTFKVTDAIINGEPLNIFLGTKEKISDSYEFSVEPWGYIVYDYQ